MTQDLVQAQPDKQADGWVQRQAQYIHNFLNFIGLMPHVLVPHWCMYI